MPSISTKNSEATELRSNQLSDKPMSDIYFLHIPKTAGTSFASFVRQAYPKQAGIPAHHWQHLVSLSLDQINSYSCYSGHFGTGLFSLLNREIPTVTILRDPFDRAVSHLVHASPSWSKEFLPCGAKRIRDRWPIHIEYLFHKLKWSGTQIIMRDLQTRTLGVDVDLRSRLGRPVRRDFAFLLKEAQGDQKMSSVLARAKERLNSMALVGTVERFAETIELLSGILGVTPPENCPILNVGPKTFAESYRPYVPEKLARFIDSITEHDRELYAHANALLEQQISRSQA